MCKKIISFFVVFAIVASSLLPTFAAETGSFYRPVGITEWADDRDPNGGFSNILEDYDSYVDTLPGSVIDSSGGFVLTVPHSYVRFSPNGSISGDPASYFSVGNDPNPGTMTKDDLIAFCGCDVTYSCDMSGIDISFLDGKAHSIWVAFYFDSQFPIDGVYTSLDFYYNYRCITPSSDVLFGQLNTKVSNVTNKYCVKGMAISDLNWSRLDGCRISVFDFCGRQYLCIPDEFNPFVDSTSNPYSSFARPSSITGDYGIIGDNGTIIKVDGDMIVDESSNTIYNPVTNTTISFTDYTYDYSDRSYNLTLGDGSTMRVIYGDENITINEGDTTYNIYYIIEDDSGSDGGSSGDKHTHDYTSEITKQPSCLISGVRTFTCACGDSYTKTISATGHDWVISQQVPTTYDPETGEQTQAGYTVYVCGSCAEQYKSTDGSAPPNGSSGGDDGSGGFGDIIVGLFSVIGDIIGGLLEGALVLATKALEALTGLGDLFAQMIETILGFFGGFLDFLSAMFPFLPEETITILNFGLILMIAAAVFNKFFK